MEATTGKPSYRYSMLSSAYTCQRKFQLQYIDNASSGLPDSGDMSFGTAVHAGLNAILEGADGNEVFKMYWDSERGRNLRFGMHSHSELASMGPIFLDRFARLHAKNFTPFSMEERLTHDVGDYLIEGTPDYIGEFRGVPTVLDFKTSLYPYPNERILHNPQLYIYDFLARETLGYNARNLVYLVFVKKELRIQTVQLELTSARREEMKAAFMAGFDELHARRSAKNYPKNLGGCMMGKNVCDFFEKCHGKNNS